MCLNRVARNGGCDMGNRGGSRNVEGGVLIVHVQGRRKQLVVALAVYRGVKHGSVRAKRGKIFSPSFFSRLDWLS